MAVTELPTLVDALLEAATNEIALVKNATGEAEAFIENVKTKR